MNNIKLAKELIKIAKELTAIDSKVMWKAFQNACVAAGVRTRGNDKSFYKNFTNLSKRAYGPRGGSRYNIKQWPYIWVKLVGENEIEGGAFLEDISGLTGYQPDKSAGFDVEFPKLMRTTVTPENVGKVIKDYVDDILKQWNALPGYRG